MTSLPTYSSGINCEEDCNCPGCSPAGDLFVPPSEVNPRRRIIRARRPQSDPNNLSSAIGFLQQANNSSSTTTATRGGGTQRSGEVSDSDDESMPPLEDIDNTAASLATLSTARRGRNSGNNNGSNSTGNRFGALGEY